jgi:hypothetical protein
MDEDKVRKAWWDYLKEQLKVTIFGPPPIIEFPNCGTCSHWCILNETDLANVQDLSPIDQRKILQGMAGEYELVYGDPYKSHTFYGYCKRYPPRLMEQNSYEVGRSILYRLNILKPRVLPVFIFPIIAHNQLCGEYKQSAWIEEEKLRIKNKENKDSSPTTG